jgi:hypothetical protein
MSDVIYTQPIETPIATRASTGGQETDWSGWQRWLDGGSRSSGKPSPGPLPRRSTSWKRNATGRSANLNSNSPAAPAASTCSVPARAYACAAPSTRTSGTTNSTLSRSMEARSLRPRTTPVDVPVRIGNCWRGPASAASGGPSRQRMLTIVYVAQDGERLPSPPE